ncbi:centromere protein Q [Myripristis murdjan]|uniref:Centromere protein Q n=1 Tax=Myripristis murdjan TaxID=586833 RepID=A0A667WWU3_9TELE|nr:centromere protein Q [Myripristis murdjan]
MKPVRGSSRSASKAPNLKRKSRAAHNMGQQAAEPQESEPGVNTTGKSSHPKPLKRRAKGASSASNKVRGQDKWRLMPSSSILALENTLDLAILWTLNLTRTEKKEVQNHLNIVKNRFLAQCAAELRVPVQRQKHVKHSSRRHHEEAKKLLAGKTTLNSLEEDLRAVLNVLERTEEQTASLDHKCNTLRDKVEEEEERGNEILQMRDEAILNLPSLPPHRDSPSALQNWMANMMPKADSETAAQQLGEILQKSSAIWDAQSLLAQAHRHANQLLNPRVIPVSDAVA